MLYRAYAGAADLHASVPELVERLGLAVEVDDHVDAYLYACGIGQVVEDRLDGTDSILRRVVRCLDARGGAAGERLRNGVDAAAAVAWSPARLALRRWHGQISALTSTLADAVLAGSGDAALVPLGLADALGVVPGGAGRLLAGTVLRQPSCFRSFDQRPGDVRELAARFADQYPDRSLPVLVLGVRTSGSYLAPLLGSALRSLRYADVVVRTVRPGGRLLPGEGRMLRRLRGRGLVALIDDPPSSGASLDAVARAVERAGFRRDRVVVVCAAFADGGVTGRPCVVLPARDWQIRRDLGRESLRWRVASALRDPDIAVVESEQPDMPTRSRHLAVPITVRTGDGTRLPMVAEAVGLGYLGRHAAEIARELGGEVPRVYGVVDGVMIRARMAGEGRERGAGVPPEVVADYVDCRRRALLVPADRSVLLSGRQPAWEIAARILARGFGRLGTPVRPLLVDPLMRALSKSDQPCLIDGDTVPGLWYSDDIGGWAKTAFADGCFSHLDLASYDALYDLAAAAVAEPVSEDRLLARYEQVSGEHVPASRWCVYKLVHAWNAHRRGGASPRRQQAQAVRRFLADLFLADLESEPQGPWCALDVDGCLENDAFGFSVSSPSGAMALRALRAHGLRVVLATGRSLAETRDLCVEYRLFGGVAEYGAVAFEAASGRDSTLVPEHDGELAAALGAMPGVSVDRDYRCCVRASREIEGGRSGLGDGQELGLREVRNYAVVEGDGQTDFLPSGLDKADGVRELIRWAGGGDQQVALAVGDSAPDIAMLKAAELGFAPRNADRGVMASAGIRVLRHPYQAGLAEAVGRLLGHRVGGCPLCRMPELEAEDRALLALLAIPEAGRSGVPVRAAKLAVATRRLAGRAAAS